MIISEVPYALRSNQRICTIVNRSMSVSNIFVSPVRGERHSVEAAPFAPGGILGDRKFKTPPTCGCEKKAKQGTRELLIVDREFTSEPGIYSENLVVKGVQVWRAPPGSILSICPSSASIAEVSKSLGSSDHSKLFAQKMAELKRSCFNLVIHNKRDCAGTAEEARGERGVFASIQSSAGIMAVGDIAILAKPGQ